MTEVTTKLGHGTLKRFAAMFMVLCLCMTMSQVSAFAASLGNGDTVNAPGSSAPTNTESERTVTGGEGTVTDGEGTVTDGEGGNKDILPSSISLDKTTLAMKAGQTERLTATVGPETATDKTVTWKTSNPEVADVVNGAVTAKANGQAEITAETSNGKKAVCKVTVTTDVTGISLDKTTLAMKAGQTERLTATVTPETATDKTVTWKTSNPEVADVADGVVTAKANGQAEITAETSNGVKAVCKVTVTTDGTGISLDKTALAMKAGQTEKLTATVTPETASDKAVTWKTSNPEVADVADGVVTAKANGQAEITAETSNGVKAVCKVTVTTDVAGISLDKTTATVVKGETLQLNASVQPATASDAAVTWTSSDTKIATVDANGLVKGVKGGDATITVMTANGLKASCKVSVAAITLNSTSLPLQKGKTTTALKVATKSISSDKVASWKSSNTKIATVTSSGKIKGIKTGKATITVTMKSGASASCKVTVQKGKVVTKKLSISSTKLTLQTKKTSTLTVTRNPISATEKITWSSSNTKVATVNSKGKVTAKKAGTATITAKTSNGKKVTCKVTVKAPKVTLKKTSGTVKVGKTVKIEIKSTYPSKDTVKSYKSSNKKVATVDKNGKVKGIKKGKATITVTMKSGAKATYKVTVK